MVLGLEDSLSTYSPRGWRARVSPLSAAVQCSVYLLFGNIRTSQVCRSDPSVECVRRRRISASCFCSVYRSAHLASAHYAVQSPPLSTLGLAWENLSHPPPSALRDNKECMTTGRAAEWHQTSASRFHWPQRNKQMQTLMQRSITVRCDVRWFQSAAFRGRHRIAKRNPRNTHPELP